MTGLKTKDFLYFGSSPLSIVRENVEVENTVIAEGKAGIISLSQGDNKIGNVLYSVVEYGEEKFLSFEGLASKVEGKGVGTKLICELVKLSKDLGGKGRLIAQASPFRSQNNSGQDTKRPMSNLGFYYKLGFRADNAEKDKKIKDCIEKGDSIPLSLNVFTNISLSEEAGPLEPAL